MEAPFSAKKGVWRRRKRKSRGFLPHAKKAVFDPLEAPSSVRWPVAKRVSFYHPGKATISTAFTDLLKAAGEREGRRLFGRRERLRK